MSDFATVVADPPWRPILGGTWSARVDKGRPQKFYSTLSLEVDNDVIITALVPPRNAE
jgi:hypothetical protein